MQGLLASGERPVVEVREGRGPLVFVCEHASNRLPASLGTLGLTPADLTRHIAWDPGAAPVASALAGRLGGDLILQRYSRLVIDCNRPPAAASSVPPISEATAIPGNQGITQDAADERRRLIFEPYHRRIAEVLDRRARDGKPTILVSLHSFTPIYTDVARPWHIGTLYHRDHRLPKRLLRELRTEPALVVGDNQPYAVSDATDYTIPVHGEARGLINTGIEIRQDLITDEAGQRQWAERLIRILRKLEPELRALI